jgi:hypothetical protein
MPTFPRAGTELAATASLLYGRAVYERPGISIEFENGWKERRTRGETGRYKQFVVHCRLSAADRDTIFNFLKTQDLFAQSFTVVHPDYGSLTANYLGTELPIDKIVGGTTAADSWFEFDVPMEAQF